MEPPALSGVGATMDPAAGDLRGEEPRNTRKATKTTGCFIRRSGPVLQRHQWVGVFSFSDVVDGELGAVGGGWMGGGRH